MMAREYMSLCDGVTGGATGECSSDAVTVWHGMATPARACGRHATYDAVAVYRGHRARLATRAAIGDIVPACAQVGHYGQHEADESCLLCDGAGRSYSPTRGQS